jgi:hypothetical protein
MVALNLMAKLVRYNEKKEKEKSKASAILKYYEVS